MSEEQAAPALQSGSAKRAALALYLIVFTSGACLMGMEIVGARILAPGFGTSTFVWGSIIGLFMGALAAGYYIGGNLSDRKPSFVFLATIVSISGLLTAAIPRFGPALSDWVARMDLHIIVGPLLAASMIFFLPSFLMGMVSPYAVKLNTSSLSSVGGVAGRLYALSTFGSIVGTLLTTFFLIPYISVSNVLQLLGLTLIACAIVSLFMFRSAAGMITRQDRIGLSVMLLFALMALEAWAVIPVTHSAAFDVRVLHYEDSAYHEILVTETVIQKRASDYILLPVHTWKTDNREGADIKRWLKFNDNTESGIYPYRAEYRNAVNYTDLLHLPLLWTNNPAPAKILVIGGGGGLIPMQYAQWYKSECHIAEIDGAVAKISQDWFGVPKDNKQIIFHIGDGRQTLRKMPDHSFDVIVLDAYSSGGQIPFHLMTWEFMAEARSKLTERGVLVTNIISAMRNIQKHDIPPADLFLSNYKTLSASQYDVSKRDGDSKEPLFKQLYVFPKVYAGQTLSGNTFEDYRNVIIVATNETSRMSQEAMSSTARALLRGDNPLSYVRVSSEDFNRNIAQLYEPLPEEIQKAQILSDDFAPVDLMYRPVRREETMTHLW